MDAGLATSLVWLAVVVIVIGAVAFAIVRARRKAREIAQAAFGTDSLIDGFKKTEAEVMNTPKSVSAATSLYLPQIHKDFPEFNFADMRVRAENVLTSYLRAIDERDPSLLVEGSQELREQLQLRLSELANQGQKEQFDDIRTHRTEIARYEKRNGRCTVTFQTSVQYRHALANAEGTVLKGDKQRIEQARYNVELVYVQDRDKVEDDRDRGEGLNCPNCGAPITNVGAKKCEYCGTSVVPYNIRVWAFHRVEEG